MPKSSSYHRRTRMPFLLPTACKAIKFTHFLPAIVITVLVFSNAGLVAAADMKPIAIGAIVDVNTRAGKEVRAAIEVAARNFNKSSMNHKLSLHFRNPGENPLRAAYAAEELIQEKHVQALVGMKTWEQTALVAEVGKKSKVPIISFAEAAAEPSTRKQWPFLFSLASNVTEQIRCITYIIGSFNWRKVIVIYEMDSYGGDSGIYAAFSETLVTVGVEMEHRVVFPTFSSLSDPESYVREAMDTLLSKQSRVFIVLQSSLSLAAYLFKEAKRLRLSGNDSFWIITDSIASHLDSVDNSVISNMEGFVGVRTYFSEENRTFLDFKHQFKQFFRSEFPEEDSLEIGIHALRAYDSIGAITNAVTKMHPGNISPAELGRSILESNFAGLSGNISFNSCALSIFRIINVVGKSYKGLGFWSSKVGFSKNLNVKSSEKDQGTSTEFLASSVNWPGDLHRVPKGWSMPTDVNPLRIRVPGRTTFEKFVKVNWNASINDSSYSGFCIDIFLEVLKIIPGSYPLPYKFFPFNGTYDELVDSVANKNFDAVIGDVTILANRSRHVEFTQPFAESGVTMVVAVKPEAENQAWIFLKPFTKEMWALTGVIFTYTVLIIWLLERQFNPEFQGPWWSQMSTAFWFIFTSLFFAQRERVDRNFSRAVVLAWFVLVFTLTSSYTASLSSMLTVPRLRPNVTDIEWLKRTDAKIGCDGDSFVRKYLEEVLQFKAENIENIDHENKYPVEFERGNITAAFLELPYEKAFLNEHCKGYTVARNTARLGRDRFGGLGFVFQKGSPMAKDFSEAILTLSENGILKQLEINYFSPSPECSQTSDDPDSLNWRSFWGLYLFSAVTSTICYLLSSVHQIYLNWRKERQ